MGFIHDYVELVKYNWDFYINHWIGIYTSMAILVLIMLFINKMRKTGKR